MQITVQSIPVHSGGAALARQIEAFLRELLLTDREHLLELEIRHGLGCETEDDDIHCEMSARLASGERVHARHAAPTLVRALSGAVGKLRSTLQPADTLAFAP
jgi:hypothetical protein